MKSGETYRVLDFFWSHDGNAHSGSFTLDFFDPSGNFQFEVAGDVTGERISVE